MRAEDARVLNKAVELMFSRGEIKQHQKEKALVILAEKYLQDGKVSKERGVKNDRTEKGNKAKKA